ncbi:hypothetical protein KHA80_11950 [Anaerobacillus sp. HL2]|nr:hypothetical protein KHA80_11950 [Anaerobacillus sp. HL2]
MQSVNKVTFKVQNGAGEAASEASIKHLRLFLLKIQNAKVFNQLKVQFVYQLKR